jgi:hypothetical protein
MFQPSTMVKRRCTTLPSRIAINSLRGDVPGSSAYSPTCSRPAAPSCLASARHSISSPCSTPAARSLRTTTGNESPFSTSSVSPASRPDSGASAKLV